MIGGFTADVKVMEVNRRVSIVTVGVALDGLRGGWSGWEEVDVMVGGPVCGQRLLITGREVTPHYRGQRGGVIRCTDV